MPGPTSDTAAKILKRINDAAPNGVWSRADFLDLASPSAVEKTLQRLMMRGEIRRPHRGLYDKPGKSKLTGRLVFPPRSSFVDAIARRDNLRVLVDGMTAANDIGLTTAIPARSTIYADTHPRTMEIEASFGDPGASLPVIYRLDFKRVAAKSAFWAGRPAMRVVQALNWFGKEDYGEAVFAGLTRYLNRIESGSVVADDLIANAQLLPAWMYPIARRLSDTLLPHHLAPSSTLQPGQHETGLPDPTES